ncbi:MAG: DNA (cytosine-5-)-methyltransferase, partial [Desulfovibrionaceae bacterium]|nr:DNA (cytosine-5-)-methyltransferase [Desulfovibrionaceae bacterium]
MNGQQPTPTNPQAPRVGSLFAGIGGFDLGFEQAGFTTAWQVEIDPLCRAVLARHFPHARRYDDVRAVGVHNLEPVEVLVGGFPCQDVSSMGARAGLAGNRTGLFWEVCRIAAEIRPQWLVLENVVGLLNSHAGRD